MDIVYMGEIKHTRPEIETILEIQIYGLVYGVFITSIFCFTRINNSLNERTYLSNVDNTL